jgi:hypothetical protein
MSVVFIQGKIINYWSLLTIRKQGHLAIEIIGLPSEFSTRFN